jgi:hypothetical protein
LRSNCTFEGCGKPLLAKGYCSAHYRQSRKGKPLRPIRPFSGKTGPYGPGDPCRFNARKRCIIGVGRGAIIALRILNCGLEVGNRPEYGSVTS